MVLGRKFCHTFLVQKLETIVKKQEVKDNSSTEENLGKEEDSEVVTECDATTVKNADVKSVRGRRKTLTGWSGGGLSSRGREEASHVVLRGGGKKIIPELIR